MVSGLVACKVLSNFLHFLSQTTCPDMLFNIAHDWVTHQQNRSCRGGTASLKQCLGLRSNSAAQVCNELLTKAWEQAQSFVHSGFGIPTKAHMLRMLRHSCEFQARPAPHSLHTLTQWDDDFLKPQESKLNETRGSCDDNANHMAHSPLAISSVLGHRYCFVAAIGFDVPSLLLKALHHTTTCIASTCSHKLLYCLGSH